MYMDMDQLSDHEKAIYKKLRELEVLWGDEPNDLFLSGNTLMRRGKYGIEEVRRFKDIDITQYNG